MIRIVFGLFGFICFLIDEPALRIVGNASPPVGVKRSRLTRLKGYLSSTKLARFFGFRLPRKRN